MEVQGFTGKIEDNRQWRIHRGNLNISQGSVGTHLRGGEIFNDLCIANETVLKTGQYLTKLREKFGGLLFSIHGVVVA